MSTLRLLIVMPSWVGDAVMATPALQLIRSRLPGVFIGGLVRPGIDQVLAGTEYFDEVHADRPAGMMGYKHIAARLRHRRYDTALLLTNSFSTALITRLAGVPRRIGYNRDARGLLLTDPLVAPRRADGRWAVVPAVSYYWYAARHLLREAAEEAPGAMLPRDVLPMRLGTTAEERGAAGDIFKRAKIGAGEAYCILNPGGNNPAKRWPAERFVALAGHLASRHGLRVLINGSPAEAELVRGIVAGIGGGAGLPAVSLPEVGGTLGSLKAMLADARCRLMVTNDTGPRHIAAAMGVPVVSLFGPTDARWTTIPVPRGREAVLVADPTLPEGEIADDHPERCQIEKITAAAVFAAADELLGHGREMPPGGPCEPDSR